MPRGIVADVIEDLGMTRQEFYFKKFSVRGRLDRLRIKGLRSRGCGIPHAREISECENRKVKKKALLRS